MSDDYKLDWLKQQLHDTEVEILNARVWGSDSDESLDDLRYKAARLQGEIWEIEER